MLYINWLLLKTFWNEEWLKVKFRKGNTTRGIYVCVTIIWRDIYKVINIIYIVLLTLINVNSPFRVKTVVTCSLGAEWPHSGLSESWLWWILLSGSISTHQSLSSPHNCRRPLEKEACDTTSSLRYWTMYRIVKSL